jgi:hypothetical protein
LLAVHSPALWRGGLVKATEEMRRLVYFGSAILVLIGIFSIRWNVVIGGQLFSKSLRGLTVYKLELFGLEGLLVASVLMILPFIILWALIKIVPPWTDARPTEEVSAVGS